MSIFKLSKKGVALAIASTLGLGAAGQASADVYGGSYLQLDNLLVSFSPIVGGGANLYTFTTDSEARLDNVIDPSDGGNACGGQFGVFTTCVGANPRLSGAVQNAPGSGVIRADNTYGFFGANDINYSNAEAAIDTAVLLGDATTSSQTVAESNLHSRQQASAGSSVQSNTELSIQFSVGANGTFDIDFEANLVAEAKVTQGDTGLAQASTSVTLSLTDGQGTVYARWTPDGNAGVDFCGAGLTCTDTDPESLSYALSSSGLPDIETVSDAFNLNVTGLASGDYNLVLFASTGTNLIRVPVPVPGTLFLMGVGLLAAGGLRRKK